MGDSGDDTRWMTYAELAEARGIKEPAAVRLVQRRHWERHQGNDGSARVAVPLSELRPSKAVAPAGLPVAPDSQDVEALARERLRSDQAEARADRAEAREAEARTDADQVRRERDTARQEREDARVRAASAEGEAKALREALADARRPFWQRWFGA